MENQSRYVLLVLNIKKLRTPVKEIIVYKRDFKRVYFLKSR